MADHPSAGMTMEWLMEDAIVPDAGLSLARMTIGSDVTSEAHRRPNCTEAIHVLAGKVMQRKGADWVRLAAGDTIQIPAGAPHRTRNTGPDTAVLMVAYSAGPRIFEALPS